MHIWITKILAQALFRLNHSLYGHNILTVIFYDIQNIFIFLNSHTSVDRLRIIALRPLCLIILHTTRVRIYYWLMK